jgi:hypothetical protein
MAHHHDDEDEEQRTSNSWEQRDLDKYELWTVMKEQVRILREEMEADSEHPSSGSPSYVRPTTFSSKNAYLDDPAEMDTVPDIQGNRQCLQRQLLGAFPQDAIVSPEAQLRNGYLALEHDFGGMTMNGALGFTDANTRLPAASHRHHN